MKLYIIGNGFDRGHSLPTQYWDFRTYLSNVYPDFLCAFESHYDIYPSMDEESKRSLLWNELETNLANIDEDIIIEEGKNICLDLESGDIGIEDTLYDHFSTEYGYIRKLAQYLKQWVRTIRIRDVRPKTTHIQPNSNALYITFNYTAVLETVYGISPSQIIHIHGSLRNYDDDPILGHGNKDRIEHIEQMRLQAKETYDEKKSSICEVVEDYYKRTFKDIQRFAVKLWRIVEKDVDEITVIGHSLAGVDLPYFRDIDLLTNKNAKWTVYYFKEDERDPVWSRLLDCGIDAARIEMVPSNTFYDIK